MCEQCVKNQASLDRNRERFEKTLEEIRQFLAGNFTEAEQKSADAFPEGKEFMQKLWILGLAGMRLATLVSLIDGTPPSMTLGEWAGVALEAEMENGVMSPLMAIVMEDDEFPKPDHLH